MSFPKYEYYIADQKYANFAKKIGLSISDEESGVDVLIDMVNHLNEKLGIPKSFQKYGIDEETYMNKLDILANNAFEDQCTTSNPRLPLVSELKKILIDAYYGIDV